MKMFKKIILVIVLISSTSSQLLRADVNISELKEELIKISSIYQQKCLINTNVNTFQNIFHTFSDASCIKTNLGDVLTDVDCKNTFSKEFLECLKKMGNLFSACLDNDEKYLPDLLINGLQRILQKFCSSDYIQRFSRFKNLTCNSGSTKLNFTDHLVSSCVPNLNIIQNARKGIVSLRKDVVCGDISTLQECLDRTLKSDCAITNEDIQLINSVIDEYQKECFKVGSSAGNAVHFNLNPVFAIVLFLL